jgi:hypothetical protein
VRSSELKRINGAGKRLGNIFRKKFAHTEIEPEIFTAGCSGFFRKNLWIFCHENGHDTEGPQTYDMKITIRFSYYIGFFRNI